MIPVLLAGAALLIGGKGIKNMLSAKEKFSGEKNKKGGEGTRQGKSRYRRRTAGVGEQKDQHPVPYHERLRPGFFGAEAC